VSLDLGWWHSSEEEQFFRDAIAERLEMDESQVFLALSHTHSGPSFCESAKEKPGGHLIRPYLEHLRNAMVAAVKGALASAQAAILESGVGWCDLARNRDLRDPQKERWLVGWNLEAAADPTLLVGRISAADGQV
jgi:hypothetical protein